MLFKDRICTLFFCHSHSALCNVYPIALDAEIEDKHCQYHYDCDYDCDKKLRYNVPPIVQKV